MTKPESPFILVQASNTEITKTSLSALIQHKMQVAKTYPARVTEFVNGVAFIEIFPPILRQMQDDHPQMESASNMRLHANVRVGDPILIQVQQGQWELNTTLTEDAYTERLHREIKERLLMESRLMATPQSKRASKRILEQMLHLSPSESTPWGVPGRMKANQKLVSKKILQWCVNQSGAHFQSRLQEAFPSSKEWGEVEQYFSVFIDATQETFIPVSITQDEHKSLVEMWADVLRNRTKVSTNSLLPVATPSPAPVLPKPISARPPTSIDESANPSLPKSVIELARSFHLPVPIDQPSSTLSTLAAWTQSDHLLLKERSTDVFLMMLSNGEPVRQNTSISKTWATWHKNTDEIDQLCSVIEDGEELAAVRALAGQAFLNPHTASNVCDQLLLRWRRNLIQKHSLSEKALGKPLRTTASHMEYRRAMRLHGIQCSDTWLDQLLLAIQIAPQMGMMVVLIGEKSSSKILVELLSAVFEGATHSQIRLPRNRAQLFGKPSTSGDIFLHSDFGLAVRKGGYRKRYGEIGLWNPHLVWMDNLYPHAKRDSLSLLIQEMYFGDGVELYKEDDNERYYEEYQSLQSKDSLNATEQTRRDELEDFFDAKTIGGYPIEKAWRLNASDNTVLLGHISHTELDRTPPALLQRALVLEVPNFSPERVQYRIQAIEDWIPLVEGRRHFRPKATWKQFPRCREELFQILDILHGRGITVNDLLAKQVSFLLAAAEAWQLPDNSLLTYHMCKMIVWPRIQGMAETIFETMEDLETLPFIAPQLRQDIGRLKRLATQHKGQQIYSGMPIRS